MRDYFIHSSTGKPFNHIKNLLSDAKDNIILIVPYIKTESLRQIIPESNVNITIITSWKVQDLWYGASDLSLYTFAKERSFRLFLNNRIHLKVYMIDWQKCIFGSANLTRRGLGTSDNYNYELNSIQTEIDTKTLLYFRSILAESLLVNDGIYEKYKLAVDDLPPKTTFQDPKLDDVVTDTEFLISSLPMSWDINSLYNLYSNDFSSDAKEAKECAMHDVVLFKIPFGLKKEDFIYHLKHHFFKSAFIKKLLEYIDEEDRYFGRVKEWIQSNCTDVPVPSRRDLTGNIQVLYKWIVQLSDGRYLVDRPNYSERIYKVK